MRRQKEKSLNQYSAQNTLDEHKIQKERNVKHKILALLIILTFILSACGQPAAPATTDAAPGDTSSNAGNPVVVRMWVHTNNAFITGYDGLIAAYEAAHPNIDIQLENFEYSLYLQTLQTAMPAGEEADIIQMFGTWTSQYYERLAPVPADVMTIDTAQKTFYSAPIGGFIVDGKLYGMPQEFNCEYGGVLVNKTLYEAAGLTYPPQWKTMDDVLVDGVALSKKDDSGMMTTAGFHFTNADASAFS
jgi:multiple sugar transport system substrate-binding protein